MDQERFFQACQTVLQRSEPMQKGIGTLSEKTLHACLKSYFEPYDGSHEIKVGRYVADIVGENGIIEIQTRQFRTMRKKLEAFLSVCDVTVVYPIAQTKWLCWIDPETGEISPKRKSPKQGRAEEIFWELYWIKPFLKNPRLHFCIVLLELEEYRYLNGWSHDKKRGSSRCERIPISLQQELYINDLRDYRLLIPEQLPEEFTASDYQKASKLSLSSAQTALNILTYVEAVERIGKRGRAYLYRRCCK